MLELIPLAVAVALVASALYFFVGLIPGTDETSSIAPVILILVLMNLPPAIILAFFMAAISAMETTNTVPSAIALVPGSTMAIPFVEPCQDIRRLGIPHIALRKMLAASVIGSVVALPVALGMGRVLIPVGTFLKNYIPLIFFIGAIIVALISKARLASVAIIIPFSFFIGASQKLSVDITKKSLFIAYFMGIASGPMLIDIISLLSPRLRGILKRKSRTTITIAAEPKTKTVQPWRVLGTRQATKASIFGILSSFIFFLSPVGMTVIFGEIVRKFKGSYLKRSLDRLVVMDAVTNSTYIAETIIPLVAIGLPLSPMALGPAAPLFNAPPRFYATETRVENIHTLLSFSQIALFSCIGLLVGLLVSYLLSVGRARKWCKFTLQHVSVEALIATFIGLAALLSFYEGGVTGVVAAFSTALLAGLLKRLLDVDLGVLYMAFYAAPYVIKAVLR